MAVPIGKIMAFGGAVAPASWLECDGAAVLRATYPALYAIIGDRYGEGDGVTTFNLPDFRGKFIRGYDHGIGNDPDAGGRTAQDPGGDAGDAVGSIQADEYESHVHQWTWYDDGTAPPGLETLNNNATPNVFTTTATGGNETRPINPYIMMIIAFEA